MIRPTRTRRAAAPLGWLVATLSLALVGSGALPAAATPAVTAAPATSTTSTGEQDRGPGEVSQGQALASYAAAERLLTEPAREGDPSVTQALGDLWLSLPLLPPAARTRAEALLARPSDGAADPQGFGYTVPSVKKCTRNVCLHWVRSTTDAPPSKRWVKRNLKQLQKVWRIETGKLGYRKPLKDGRKGGNGKFDVYLKDVGAFGFYGFCAREKRRQRFLATGYCVLDNDFSRAQFGNSSPKESLKVTAAHEFFHAIQFAYDAEEDGWFTEATATWMEERVADGANDNRQFLPLGQVANPRIPLDSAAGGSLAPYGNWAFFEYLAKRYGNGIVRQIWQRAAWDKRRASNDSYSTKAISQVLRSRGDFKNVFAAYAAGNTIPGKTYPEGNEWPTATISDTVKLGKSNRRMGRATKLSHLSSVNYVIKPDSSLRSKRWRVNIKVKGPQAKTSPAAYLLIDRRRGGVIKRPIRLNGKGNGTAKADFSKRKVKKVTVTMANASTRFKCYRQTAFSCRGKPKDNGKRFKVTATLRK